MNFGVLSHAMFFFLQIKVGNAFLSQPITQIWYFDDFGHFFIGSGYLRDLNRDFKRPNICPKRVKIDLFQGCGPQLWFLSP